MESAGFLNTVHDARDPSPWLALYLDQSTPLPDPIKQAWLMDSAGASRQYLLPVVRPFARAMIVLIQVVKIFLPKRWSASKLLHRLLAWGLENFVSQQANWLILRHFHLGSQIMEFVAANAALKIPLSPLTPKCIDDLKDELFLKHDLNLFNFVIRFNQALRDANRSLTGVDSVDFSMITEPTVDLKDMPARRTNWLDLQTAIEIFTPIYQFFLTDNDFWRASNSLQLDETMGMYVATLLNSPQHLILLNNKHPLVPMSTLRAGHRLVLHGLSTEMLHGLLSQMKKEQAQAGVSGKAHPTT